MLRILAIIGLSLFCSSFAVADTTLMGEFAQVDQTKSQQTIAAIKNNDSETIDTVINSPEKFSPDVFFVLSDRLFRSNRKYDALVWAHLGLIRAKSDANKSLDSSVADAVAALGGLSGKPINIYGYTNISRLRSAITEAVVMDQEISREYDARWVALHGIDAQFEEKIAFRPKSEWSDINDEARILYLDSMNAVLDKLEKK